MALKERYGLSFDAGRVSHSLYGRLTEKLSDKLSEMMRNPHKLPGEGPVRERIEQVVEQTAQRVVNDFVKERTEAVGRLHEMRARGEIKSEDMASFTADGYYSLADVVMHHRIPPTMLPKLYALRSETPDSITDLASSGHTMEHKIQVLEKFGDALSGIYSGLSRDDYDKYLYGEDNKLNYTEDCGRFLLEGKLSATGEDAIRSAVTAGPSGSDLSQLCEGVAAMKREAYNPDGEPEQWTSATAHLDRMWMAALVLMGPEVLRVQQDYTERVDNVAVAMRNCGIDVPAFDGRGIE